MRLSMSAISHGIADTASLLRTLFDVTLFQIQRRHCVNVDNLPTTEMMVNKSVKELVSKGAIMETNEGKYELSSIAIAAVAGTTITSKQELVVFPFRSCSIQFDFSQEILISRKRI